MTKNRLKKENVEEKKMGRKGRRKDKLPSRKGRGGGDHHREG